MIKEKEILHFRHEDKHRINLLDDVVLSGRLRKIFTHDLHADSHGIYRVSSLYFDTPYDKALKEKINGVNRREKFRLRYYNNDVSFVRLEKKIKVNGLCAKQSCNISTNDAQRIINGDIGFLLKVDNPLMPELYSKMRGEMLEPKTVVCYDREAFTYLPGNVRITIDRNLQSGIRSVDFFNFQKRRVDVSDSISILEVKYDSFLPDIVRKTVHVPNRRAEAYSKYAICRQLD